MAFFGFGVRHAKRISAACGKVSSILRALELVGGKNFGYHAGMLIVHVHIRVKSENLESFIAATKLNARLSRLELGVLQFDVLQQADDGTKFLLVEIYRDAAAQAAHKETPHYAAWRDAVASMMAEPRTSVKFNGIAV